MNNILLFLLFTFVLAGIITVIRSTRNKKKALQQKLNAPFPEAWRLLLKKHIVFYNELNATEKILFEKRVQLFIATKNIEGVETEIDDTLRLMIASSAVIPTFAFPEYNYPGVATVLLYPNSFDAQFQTQRYKDHKEFITGMADGRNGIVILSKPDLVNDFDGQRHNENVGIHEFMHLLDKEDGIIDGIPEALLKQQFVGPWLHEIKSEINRIETGKSDINPYALTNHAEFLAVVSEYFFSNPDKFKNKHPELYEYLAAIFKRSDH
jgi:Mlc titration factor MtfA (ptsG expression regulator)